VTAKTGEEFIKHEFDEAIAIQQAIVEAERQLSISHPFPEAKQAIKSLMATDQQQLQKLQQQGKQYGATGEAEEVASSMKQLMQATAQKATEAQSDAYEAHAVLLSLKRKQQDSASAVVKIAGAMKETLLKTEAQKMLKDTKAGAEQLAKSLANFAVVIAKQPS